MHLSPPFSKVVHLSIPSLKGPFTNTTIKLRCHAWPFLKFRKALRPVKQWSNLLHNLNCSNISRTILDSMPMQRRDHHNSASQITKRFANERNMHTATDSKGCGSSKASFTQSPDASPQTAKAVAQASCTQSPDALQTNATHTKCTANMGKQETLNCK